MGDNGSCPGDAFVAKGHEDVSEVEAGGLEDARGPGVLAVARHVQHVDVVRVDPRQGVRHGAGLREVDVDVGFAVLRDGAEGLLEKCGVRGGRSVHAALI